MLMIKRLRNFMHFFFIRSIMYFFLFTFRFVRTFCHCVKFRLYFKRIQQLINFNTASSTIYVQTRLHVILILIQICVLKLTIFVSMCILLSISCIFRTRVKNVYQIFWILNNLRCVSDTICRHLWVPQFLTPSWIVQRIMIWISIKTKRGTTTIITLLSTWNTYYRFRWLLMCSIHCTFLISLIEWILLWSIQLTGFMIKIIRLARWVDMWVHQLSDPHIKHIVFQLLIFIWWLQEWIVPCRWIVNHV